MAPTQLLSTILFASLLFCITAHAGDRGADGKFDERGSSNFKLLQDVDIDQYSGSRGSRQFEISVLEVLEDAYRRVGNDLKLRPRSETVVVIYDPELFDREFSQAFGFRVAGFFNGRIYVRGSNQLDSRLVDTLYHEYVHAALASRSRDAFPAWLNEGLAEYFGAISRGKKYLSRGEFNALARASRNGSWIPMRELSTPSLGHMRGDSVGLAYLQSYAMVEFLVREYDMRKVRDLVENMARYRNPKRALDRTMRVSLEELEAELIRELQ